MSQSCQLFLETGASWGSNAVSPVNLTASLSKHARKSPRSYVIHAISAATRMQKRALINKRVNKEHSGKNNRSSLWAEINTRTEGKVQRWARWQQHSNFSSIGLLVRWLCNLASTVSGSDLRLSLSSALRPTVISPCLLYALLHPAPLPSLLENRWPADSLMWPINITQRTEESWTY